VISTTAAGPLLVLWLLAKRKGGGGSASAPTARKHSLKRGHTYRLRMEVVSSSLGDPSTMVDGMKQGLEASGARDVTATRGPPAALEYTIDAVMDVTIELGKQITLSVPNIGTFVVLWRWVREIPRQVQV